MKTDRLISIIMVLLNHKQISAGKLAEMFEVSRRTIYRDLDSIALAGIPIVTTTGTNGGISIMPDYKVDKRFFTPEEIQNLIMGLNSFSTAMSEKELTGVLEKLKGLVPQQQLDRIEQMANQITIDVNPWISNKDYKQTLNTIKDALTNNTYISFRYNNNSGESSERTVEPYQLVSKAGHWYLNAYCTLRADFRIFRLSRMTELRSLAENFEPRDNPINKLGEDKDCIDTLINVKLKVHKSLINYLTDTFGDLSFKHIKNSTYSVTIPFSEDEYSYGIILSMGEKCECVEPEHIRKGIISKLNSISEIYK